MLAVGRPVTRHLLDVQAMNGINEAYYAPTSKTEEADPVSGDFLDDMFTGLGQESVMGSNRPFANRVGKSPGEVGPLRQVRQTGFAKVEVVITVTGDVDV